jgi:hypothetical protein
MPWYNIVIQFNMGQKYTFLGGVLMENEMMLKKVVGELEFFDNLYDYIRLIDPIKKQIITYSKAKKILKKP